MKTSSQQKTLWVNLLICIGVASFWAAFYYLGLLYSKELAPWPLQKAEFQVSDLRMNYGRTVAPNPDIFFLGIDRPVEDRISEEEAASSPALHAMSTNWPWPRHVWGEVIDRLVGAGAAVVALDMLFPAPGPGDEVLQDALERHADRALIGANLFHNNYKGEFDEVVWPSDTIEPWDAELPPVVGMVNVFADWDNSVRRVRELFPMRNLGDDATVDAFAVMAARKAGRLPDRPLTTGLRMFRYSGPPSTYRAVPLYEILVPNVWKTNYADGEFFKNKLVVIGPAANWHQDHHTTPFGRMLGPEIHTQYLGALLADEYLREPIVAVNMAIILGVGIAAWVLMIFFRSPLKQTTALLALAALFVILTQWSYNSQGWLIIAFTPLTTLTTAGLGCMLRQFILERLERARTRSTLEKYVSPAIVQEILDRSEDFENSLGGARKPCTMLFSDIRGFTTMTESADSQQLVALLNEYLSEMVECVFHHQGNLDKFMGDAVMAIWGNVAGIDPASDARNAVASALEMIERLDTLNEKWATQGLPPLKNGIGLNHGEVIVGNIGSPRRKEFTVIGDPVNLASRLEGVTKEYGLCLVLGQSVAELVRDHFTLQTVDLIRVKGKLHPIDTFTVPIGNPEPDALSAYEKAVQLYRSGDFQKALDILMSHKVGLAHNDLAALYIKRCQDLITDPPEGPWDGVFTMRTK